MILRIQKHFIATVAAVAIAVTGISAAPARAGDDDAAAAIAALLGLAVIGAVIADKRKDKKQRREVIQHPHPKPHPKPLPPRVSRKLLPQQCLRSFRTDHGQRRIFGQRCLNRHYGHVHSLPYKCHREFYTDRGWRQGYGARCLNRHGYQLARR